jgi:hypothetical protein
MDLRLFLCAESVSIDQQGNRLSIFNIADEVSAFGFPAVGNNLAVVALLSRKKSEPNTAQLRIRIELNKKQLTEIPFAVDFQNNYKCRAIANVQGMIIPGLGTLKVSLFLKTRELGTWEIDVRQVGQAQLMQPQMMRSAAMAVGVVTSAAKSKKAKAKKAKGRARR